MSMILLEEGISWKPACAGAGMTTAEGLQLEEMWIRGRMVLARFLQ